MVGIELTTYRRLTNSAGRAVKVIINRLDFTNIKMSGYR